MDEQIKYFRALVIIELESLAASDSTAKPELLLSNAGFAANEIAELVGKKPEAVRKAISRAKKALAAGEEAENG